MANNPRYYSLSFRFAHGRDRKPIIVMLLALLDVSTTPKTNVIYMWRHQDTSNAERRFQSMFDIYCFVNLKVFQIQSFGFPKTETASS